VLKKIVRINYTERPAGDVVVVSCYSLWATCLKPTEELLHFLNNNSIGLLGCHQRGEGQTRRTPASETHSISKAGAPWHA